MTQSILEELKSQTREHHERIEGHLNLPARLRDVVGYQRVLAAFYGFYAPLEARLVEVLSLGPSELDIRKRLKASLIAADLGHFEIDAAELERCADLPTVDSLGSAFGSLYVLEGATLGGQIIKRLLQERMAITPANGGVFFSAYGDQVREMWNSFREALTHYADLHPGENEVVIRGAAETFTKFDRWLVQRLGDIKPDSLNSQ